MVFVVLSPNTVQFMKLIIRPLYGNEIISKLPNS